MPRVSENHAYEQFFFSDDTTRRLADLASQYARPLLLCTPSIAEALESRGHPYLLLDRDTRFSHLSGFQPFDLRRPHMVFERFDAIFTDPPFSNVSIGDFRQTVDLLAQGAPARPALYLCYINTREAALRKAFSAYGIERLFPLGYRSVKASTQGRIFLYGPPSGTPVRA